MHRYRNYYMKQQLLFPAVIYNMEVMTSISKKEHDELEKIQKTALTEIYNYNYLYIVFETQGCQLSRIWRDSHAFDLLLTHSRN